MTHNEQSDGAAPSNTQPEEKNFAVGLKSPLTGWLTSLSDVPDPVFSEGILGKGIAIDPFDCVVSAPADGVVLSAHRARHAVTLRLANGAEVLLHVGLETVALGGEGFTLHVAEGQTVAAGAPLITFDMDLVAHRAKSLMIPVVILGEGYALTPVRTDRQIAAGDDLFTVIPAAPGGAAAVVTAPSAAVAGTSKTLIIRDPDGLHARPAGLIADCAKGFDARILLRANGREADARSPVKLMLLGLAGGDTVELEAAGPDAGPALNALETLIGGFIGTARGTAPATETAPRPVTATPSPHRPFFSAGESAEIKGVQAVSGLAAGRARRLILETIDIAETGAGAALEAGRFESALQQARRDLTDAIATARSHNRNQAEILGAHLAFLDDPDLIGATRGLIADGKSAGFAWRAAASEQIAALRRLENARLAERATDLEDVERRILLILAGRQDDAGPALAEGSIILAADLLPSQLTALDASRIAGLCLAEGGPTSHVAILAATLGIPTVVAAGPDVLRVPDGTPLILDADHMTLKVNPPADILAATETRIQRRRDRASATRAQAGEDCHMADGRRIEVVANLASPSDALTAVANGAEGCGLLRSEFLFLDRDTAPSEEEQLAQYQAVADSLEGRPLIIRTLDAGADKVLPYLGLPSEENPALGLRGVRASLWQPATLRTQIRAILRIRPLGQVRIMVPMVASLTELRAVRAILDEESRSLAAPCAVPLGIMVEVPAAAVMADLFAKESDFFSIGTNDLTQYTLAMDRLNPRLAPAVDAFDPAVLRLIAQATAGAAKEDRWVSVCGGLASIPLAAPVLIGLGVTELSATASAVPEVKAMVRTLTLDRCQAVARDALALSSAAEVRAMLSSQWPDA